MKDGDYKKQLEHDVNLAEASADQPELLLERLDLIPFDHESSGVNAACNADAIAGARGSVQAAIGAILESWHREHPLEKKRSRAARAVRRETAESQVSLLRCIFGNPFHPPTLDSSWLSSTVRNLAQAIYDDRRFTDLPILADALLDAGCDNDDILTHCRSEGSHVRGCWVVDLLLDKK